MGIFGNILSEILGPLGGMAGGSLGGPLGATVGKFGGSALGGLAKKIPFKSGGIIMAPNGQMLMVVKKKATKKRKGKGKK